MISSCHTDAMVSSCHGLLNENHESLMTQSLDPNMLCGTLNNKMSNIAVSQSIEGKLKSLLYFHLSIYLKTIGLQKHLVLYKLQQN